MLRNMPFRRAKQSAALKWIIGGVVLCTCVLIAEVLVHIRKNMSLREEVLKMQRSNDSHLSQVSNNKIFSVDVLPRSLKEERQFVSKGTANFGVLSRDGAEVAFSYCAEPGFTHPSPNVTDCPAGNLHLGIVRPDGSGFLEYNNWTSPYGMCWSHDKSKLALAVSDTSIGKPNGHRLVILDRNSGTLREVAGDYPSTSSECWSPDDKRIVFTENKVGGIQNVLIFNWEQGKMQYLVRGSGASWSPEGSLIAFSNSPDSYSTIRPDGTGEKLLFSTTVGGSELWWSPDSQYVAYVSARGFFERWPDEYFIELRRLRIRRLKDGAEDWLLNLSTSDPIDFQWVTPKF
jgi:dipeptidyl aminopeptidase/acylaminoacyl peptidase